MSSAGPACELVYNLIDLRLPQRAERRGTAHRFAASKNHQFRTQSGPFYRIPLNVRPGSHSAYARKTPRTGKSKRKLPSSPACEEAGRRDSVTAMAPRARSPARRKERNNDQFKPSTLWRLIMSDCVDCAADP
ncbi:hypothetical protein SKAU_G00058120 [Synaphobranchus kaupii]|uniref:Uncharacterized protein n=1 Tax=Synaphobranchus kaupii TaxID=118154 RepID=A0A9Q1G4C6_SYNKA|nr:hypothetical protein SKAU_G00058120 [Synaphobranchus kaupii]